MGKAGQDGTIMSGVRQGVWANVQVMTNQTSFQSQFSGLRNPLFLRIGTGRLNVLEPAVLPISAARTSLLHGTGTIHGVPTLEAERVVIIYVTKMTTSEPPLRQLNRKKYIVTTIWEKFYYFYIY